MRDVSYSYLGRQNALLDITLQIGQGEQVTFMGANGSGKSTLLAILNALIYPTEGEFRAFGNLVRPEVFDSLKEDRFRSFFRRKVGFVFQNSDVQLFSSTVYDEVAFGPLQLDLPRDEVKARVEELIDMMDLGKLRDRAPHTLSGGEKKKVCIASVLAINPDVLLLDEPTAGLDPRTQLWLIELLQELGRSGKTVVTATHDLDIIEQIGQRSVVIGEDHRIVVDRRTDQVLNDLDLLLAANLIHRHMHRHGILLHQHVHSHGEEHKHRHEQDHDHGRPHDKAK
ncbi:MAG TPA: ATP-binding cassette domain-containing protein [Methanotrichaceae archaeon]|nr:ATP-binding cassette domain-containing protein [Methanotrichaceae archaeon]HQF16718.1 ATP-binding cassette domain-containing protein [Methanotrichaceae archaeon]HQI91350.1 ATP-binding cassette domain-containing protein [Methanotrichaceae archaeon]HQJ28684.1 ATP-binding cassette domain-containing protein [Methanotrichaceae archaeon]